MTASRASNALIGRSALSVSEMVDLYNSGQSIDRIAAAADISSGTVSRKLKQAGIALRGRQKKSEPRPVKPTSPSRLASVARHDEWAALRAGGLTYAEIAARYRVSLSAVCQAVKHRVPASVARGKRGTPSGPLHAEWASLRAAGLATAEIAKRYGVTPEAVRIALARLYARGGTP